MEWVVNATPRPLYPQERPGTHGIGGWVGPRAGLDRCGKFRPPPAFDPRTVQPVASRCTDWANPDPFSDIYWEKSGEYDVPHSTAFRGPWLRIRGNLSQMSGTAWRLSTGTAVPFLCTRVSQMKTLNIFLNTIYCAEVVQSCITFQHNLPHAQCKSSSAYKVHKFL